MAKQWLLPGLLALAVSGCATYPVAKNLRDQAKPMTLTQVLENPETTRGAVVIWGGRIINTVNNTNGAAIYVLQLPLAGDEKPLAYANSPGRFIASSEGFLDPESYPRGRLVTVAGTLAGLKNEPLQKTTYTYPVVAIKQIHVWPVERRYNYYYYPAWGYYYYPGWGWYGDDSPPWGVGFNGGFYGGDEDWDDGGWHHEH